MSLQISGTIVAVINIEEFIDESTLIATFGNRISNNNNISMTDVEWFDTTLYNQGTDMFLDLHARNDLNKLLPGFYLVKGYMVGECACGEDDEEFDSGFNVELLEKLPDDLRYSLNIISHYVPNLNVDFVDLNSLVKNIVCEQMVIRDNSQQLLLDLFDLLEVVFAFTNKD